MKIVELEQRSQAWHDWRAGKDLPESVPRITATAAGVIVGKSIFQTRHRLWEELTGRRAGQVLNPAMLRGINLEPYALASYQKTTGNVMAPVCVEHSDFPWAAASLDGLNVFGDLVLEIKCPGARSHAIAASGGVPTYYLPQIQWQLFVTGAGEAHYYSFDGNDGVLLTVKPDVAYQEYLFDKAVAFRQHLIDDTVPAGKEFLDAAAIYLAAKEQAREVKLMMEDAEQNLKNILNKSGEQKLQGGGVTVTKYSVSGTVDYDRLLAAMKIDLASINLFRKAESERYKISSVA
jgi:putative phage-type endonuclease